MRFIATKILLAVSLGMCVAGADPIDGEHSYDLLFKDGTLDAVERSNQLIYSRAVVNELKPVAAERDTGEVSLSFPDGEDKIARLEFRQDEKHRGLGVFPSSVGNPMIMYFYESVVRDMAEAAGGSPFYIRNRVKDALIQPAVHEVGSAVIDGRVVETQTVTLYPFADDPNKARMQGFGTLELSVTMSDEVPGWYLSLIADTPDATGKTGVYRSELLFQGQEKVETE